ncbi:phosphatidyl synthase [Rhexocercosporidium sp. MPI-PUGE-AT-0058]|nr:phosphatidyl synthase [Rhexocercosporidium sp. MPI-PUGE-AT-0058]
MMLSLKPGPCHQWACSLSRAYGIRLCPSPSSAESKFMLFRSSACLPQTSASQTSSLWTYARSCQSPKRAWHLRPQLNSRRYKGLPYSTSKRPGESQRSPGIEPKKPILKVLTKLTPHENIYTIPNILTFSRLIAAPVVGYLVLHDHHAWAVGLFAYAGITDLVDGWIARRWNLQTVVGTVIDPMADKTLMTILTVCLAIKGTLPVWLAAIILGRDVGLAITAIYYRWISLPPPKTFVRYWDFSLPSAEVHPTTISKYNTALQLALIGATTAMPLVTVDVSTAMTAMQYLVATTTVWSGASYIYSKDAVKILNQDKGS